MKKDFRFLKSLALTGMLATSILGTVAYADTENKDVKTEPIGIFNKLVSDTKNVVPFILTNREDYISKKDIEENNEFQNKTVLFDREVQEDTILHTGDTFKVNGTTYTILIYGDVNQDGYVDVFDALTIQENVFESNLSNIQKVAANVIVADDSEMDVFDALAIQQYSGEFRDTIPDKIPEKEQTEKPPIIPPVETSKIEDFESVDLTAGLDTYHRYDNKVVIGTVKSATDNVELKEKYIKYTVEKDGAPISNVLTYVEDTINKGTFNIEFYATEKGTYTITPCVEGKNGLINKTDEIITIEVKENIAITDIEVVGVSNNTITVNERKTKEFAIKFYHKYTDTVKTDITNEVAINNITVVKTENNSIVNFKQNDENKTSINVGSDGKLTGNSNAHLGYIEVYGNKAGTGDTVTIKIDNKEITLNINIEKVEIVGVTIDGQNKASSINMNLYTGIPSTAKNCEEDIETNGEGTIYKEGNDYIHEYQNKYYTIVPLNLISKENDIIKILAENFVKTTNASQADQSGKVTLTVNSQTIRSTSLIHKAYTIKEDKNTGKQTYVIASGTEEIDAIGIAFSSPTFAENETWIEAAKNGGITIDCGDGTPRIQTPVSITVKKVEAENP